MCDGHHDTVYTCIHVHVHDIPTSCGVDVDYLDKSREPPVFGQNCSDGGVSGRESVEEAEEPSQFDLSLLY